MPYAIESDNAGCSGYAVVKTTTGEVMGCHSSRAKAQAQLTALNIAEYGDDKAEAGGVRHGDFVSYRTDKGRYVGEVYDIITSGTIAVVSSSGGSETIEASEDDPVARVNIFVDNEDGTFTRSDRRVPVRISMLRVRSEPRTKSDLVDETKQVSASVRDALRDKLTEHNEDVGSASSKRTTLRALIAVFERGVGAYQTNPGSVRPTVSSAEQWAYARVNSFLYALRNGRFRRGKHDTDLLPSSHPMSTRGKSMDYELKEPFKPTAGMVAEARRGLEWRKEFNRGGTMVGVARARDIVNGRSLSADTVKRMYSFFARHEVDKQGQGFDRGEEGYPSAGRIAWALWGGDPGFSWSKAIVERMNRDKDYHDEEDGNDDMFPSRAQALARARQIGCSGAHQHPDGSWMPCTNMNMYNNTVAGREKQLSLEIVQPPTKVPTSKKGVAFGPSGRIILQDLNVALSANFSEMQKNRPMEKFVSEVEEYRHWLVELLKSEYVILWTARSSKYEELTLQRIKDLTGWLPQEWYFNPWPDPDGKGALRAHRAKERYLLEKIMPDHGEDPQIYYAIESNAVTRSMLRDNGLNCRDANRDDSSPWKSLRPDTSS